jgi:hypothetical protein
MATEKQITANRANAKRSTGPKTKNGRRASSRNALRHGLSCAFQLYDLVPRDVESLIQALVHENASDDEFVAARRIAQAQLNLLRVRSVRSKLIESLDPTCCNVDELRRLMALDRYERIARTKRRIAIKELNCS